MNPHDPKTREPLWNQSLQTSSDHEGWNDLLGEESGGSGDSGVNQLAPTQTPTHTHTHAHIYTSIQT